LAEEYRKQEIRNRIIEEQNKLRDKYGHEIAKYISERYQSYEELGKRYERYVGYLYEEKGFSVEYQGITKGKKDRGIDLIVKYKKGIDIIQCKRWGKDKLIRENAITQLIGTFEVFKHDNSSLIVGAYLYTQNDNLDDEAKSTLKKMGIHHVVCPYPFDVGKEYPLIKCNIGKDDDKIYHLPNDAMYDRIKIEIKKSESYVYTEKEAQALGFRRTKR